MLHVHCTVGNNFTVSFMCVTGFCDSTVHVAISYNYINSSSSLVNAHACTQLITGGYSPDY